MSVSPIPEGYHTATPYLIIRDAAQAIDFYKQAFGAVEILRMEQPNGKIAHAEIKIGNSPIMLADEFPEMGFKSPQSYGGSPVAIALYVPNADQVYAQALQAGASELKPLADQFYGDRSGTVTDPFGHTWTIATHQEDVSPEELRKRFQEIVQRQGNPA